MSSIARHVAASSFCLILAGCGGGGSGTTAPVDDAIPPDAFGLETDTDPGAGEIGVPTAPGADVAAPDEAPALEPGAALRILSDGLCATVGEPFEIAVDLEPPPSPDGTQPESTDVSASVTLTQSLGEGLELLSRGDGAISLRMNAQDIVALRAELSDAADPSAGRTVYAAGFAADAPASVLMTKPVAGGCLYALRLAEPRFCGNAISRGDGNGRLGTGDTAVAVDGCEYEAPEGLAVIELPPTAAAASPVR